jgi:hypothetical protein
MLPLAVSFRCHTPLSPLALARQHPQQAVSYVSRRRLDEAGFDLEAVDEEGLPFVYNEARIAAFWGNRPGELASRWTRFAAISGGCAERVCSTLVLQQLLAAARCCH